VTKSPAPTIIFDATFAPSVVEATTPSRGHVTNSRPTRALSAEVDDFLASVPIPPRPTAYDDILNRVLTPYDASAFESMLEKHNLTHQYPNLVQNLREGFPMGDFPELKTTVIFANDSSVDDHRDFVTTYIQEVAAGRMSGPYSQAQAEDILQGPFQCSPMIVSEQAQGPGEPPKLRLCRNLSKGTRAHPSTNDFIDKDSFPTKFGTAAQVAEIVSTFPPVSVFPMAPEPSLPIPLVSPIGIYHDHASAQALFLCPYPLSFASACLSYSACAPLFPPYPPLILPPSPATPAVLILITYSYTFPPRFLMLLRGRRPWSQT
jgi:hypothetical protein